MSVRIYMPRLDTFDAFGYPHVDGARLTAEINNYHLQQGVPETSGAQAPRPRAWTSSRRSCASGLTRLKPAAAPGRASSSCPNRPRTLPPHQPRRRASAPG